MAQATPALSWLGLLGLKNWTGHSGISGLCSVTSGAHLGRPEGWADAAAGSWHHLRPVSHALPTGGARPTCHTHSSCPEKPALPSVVSFSPDDCPCASPAAPATAPSPMHPGTQGSEQPLALPVGLVRDTSCPGTTVTPDVPRHHGSDVFPFGTQEVGVLDHVG